MLHILKYFSFVKKKYFQDRSKGQSQFSQRCRQSEMHFPESHLHLRCLLSLCAKEGAVRKLVLCLTLIVTWCSYSPRSPSLHLDPRKLHSDLRKLEFSRQHLLALFWQYYCLRRNSSEGDRCNITRQSAYIGYERSAPVRAAISSNLGTTVTITRIYDKNILGGKCNRQETHHRCFGIYSYIPVVSLRKQTGSIIAACSRQKQVEDLIEDSDIMTSCQKMRWDMLNISRHFLGGVRYAVIRK